MGSYQSTFTNETLQPIIITLSYAGTTRWENYSLESKKSATNEYFDKAIGVVINFAGNDASYVLPANVNLTISEKENGTILFLSSSDGRKREYIKKEKEKYWAEKPVY